MNSHDSYVPNELDRRLEQFDHCWHRGDVPLIEDFLTASDSRTIDESRRRQLLVELVLVDLEYRWQQSDDDTVTRDSTDQPPARATLPARPLLEDYVRRYPELGPLGELPSTLIADEYRVRWLWGDKPSTDQYLQRFGQQAERLRGTLQGVKQELRGKESSSGVHIRCPHCHGPVDLVDSNLSDVSCPSCGSHFSLLGREAQEDLAGGKKRLGHFELLQQIGTGSFGTVWKARDCELDRMVAVKIPRRGQLAPSEVEQFLREARAVAQLRHPNIVPVHQVGREKDTVYIASDYVEGSTLEKLIDDHRLTTGETAKLCARIADALHHAHEAGVVHRDLKPSNIIIDTRGQPHIMDFGLARREAGEITMTVDGKVLGTPAYMSPEQAKGEAHHADRRSDIYSVGVILFELLTGEQPFRGNLRMLLHHVIHDEAPSPRRFDSGIHRDLETICLKCLEKDERNRYGTCQALADEVRRFLRGEPIHARPISTVARIWRWCKRNRLVAGLGTTAAGLLLLLAIGGPLVALNQATLRRSAELAREQTRRQLYASDMIAAQTAWETANVRVLRDLLERHMPSSQQPEDLRGFAWYYLWRLCHGGVSAHTLSGHQGGTWTVAFSPDGTTLASGGQDETVRLWDAVTGELRATLYGHQINVLSLAFSPDGKTLASVGSPPFDGTVRLWDVSKRNHRRTIGAAAKKAVCLAFAPDGRTLVTGNADGTVQRWDLEAGKGPTPLAGGHERLVFAVVFSPDGNMLASGGKDHTVKLWDARTGQVLHTLVEHKSWVRELAISPDGKTLASASHDQTAKLWDVRTGKLRNTLEGHTGELWSVAFSPDGKTLATSSSDATVRLWDASTGQELDTLVGHEKAVLSVAFSRNGRTLASGGSDAKIRLWNVDSTRPRDILKGHTQAVRCVAISPDGKLLASGSVDKTIKVWDVATGEQLSQLAGHKGWVSSVAFSPDGENLASASDDGSIKLWDIPGRTEREIHVKGHEMSVWTVAFSPDGTTLASASTDGMVKLWDGQTGRESREPLAHETIAFSLAFSPDGRTLATGCVGRAGALKLWDWTTGKEMQALLADVLVYSLAFSPDGQILASGSDEGTIKLWDIATGEELETLVGHAGEVRSVAFSPDGKNLASGSRDTTIMIWDLAAGKEPETLIGHSSAVSSVAFSQDGRILVSGSADKTVRLWRRATQREVRDAGW